ncbi:hypothetical protein ACIGB6_14470 [Paeniglutamicibacter gangotriensis]|uniref:hypothetical protein n=1 Tax=Paeniglutamicibacter gangotriensis TaxID=254787 RepID=UPI0037C5C2D7
MASASPRGYRIYELKTGRKELEKGSAEYEKHKAQVADQCHTLLDQQEKGMDSAELWGLLLNVHTQPAPGHQYFLVDAPNS